MNEFCYISKDTSVNLHNVENIPQQLNTKDCGLFILYYIQQFLHNTSFHSMKDNFTKETIQNLRSNILSKMK